MEILLKETLEKLKENNLTPHDVEWVGSSDGTKSISWAEFEKIADFEYNDGYGGNEINGDKGNMLMASEYIIKDSKYIPIGGKIGFVDGKTLKPGRDYIVEKDKWVEVDFTDNIFSRVISNKAGVKKVKADNGKILFIVSDDKGNSAHGETIAKAREDLIYKAVAKFDGKLPKKATGTEWVGIYRSVTGACGAGVRNFVESTGKNLEDTYTAQEIARLVKGQYGADKFAEKVKDAA